MESTSRTNVVRLAMNWGFHEVQTMAGWESLETWAPYGKLAGHKAILFRLEPENKAITEVLRDDATYEHTFGCVLGHWPIR